MPFYVSAGEMQMAWVVEDDDWVRGRLWCYLQVPTRMIAPGGERA